MNTQTLLRYIELDTLISELKEEMETIKKEIKESGEQVFEIDEKTSIKVISGEKLSWNQESLEKMSSKFEDRFFDYFQKEYKHSNKKSIERLLEVNGTAFSKAVKKAMKITETQTVKVMRKK